MSRPWPNSSSHPPGPSGYRAPTDPRRVLIERRPPVEVDAMRRPRSLGDLTPAEQHLYAAQLAAYRAALELIHAEDNLSRIGSQADAEAVKAAGKRWVATRDTYRKLLSARPQRRP